MIDKGKQMYEKVSCYTGDLEQWVH